MSNTDDRDDIVTQNNQLMLDATHMLSTIDDLRDKISKQAFIGCLHCYNMIYLNGAIEAGTIIKCEDCHKESIMEIFTKEQRKQVYHAIDSMDIKLGLLAQNIETLTSKMVTELKDDKP